MKVQLLVVSCQLSIFTVDELAELIPGLPGVRSASAPTVGPDPSLAVDEVADLIPGVLKLSLSDLQGSRPAGLAPMKVGKFSVISCQFQDLTFRGTASF